jgi:hypothetical protein
MDTGRVEKERVESAGGPRRNRFGELLGRPVKRPAGSKPPRARATHSQRPLLQQRSAPVGGEGRRAARAQMDAAAGARVEAGAQATTQATGRLEERTRALLSQAIRHDLVSSELRRAEAECIKPSLEPGAADRLVTTVGPGFLASEGMTGAGESSGLPGAEAAERALELVERVETFLRSGRPALSLTLRGAMAGRVEVQRVAAGAISLRFESRRRPGASQLATMRAALEERGLTVQSMDVGSLTWRGDSASTAAACSPCP